MIISKTPYRISLFGGGSDFPQWYKNNKGITISTTIDYHLYITIRKLPNFFSNCKYRLSYSKIEKKKNTSEIEHPAIRAYLNYIKYFNPLEIHIDSDLPARSGTGSSSVFIVGLINAFNNFTKKIKNVDQIAKEAIHFEQNVMNSACGSQDQIIASYGGFKKIFYENNKFKVKEVAIVKKNKKKLEKNLLLFFTGFSRRSYLIENTKIKNLNLNYNKIRQLVSYTYEALKILESNLDLNQLSYLMDELWKMKKQFSKNVSNSKINDIYDFAKKNGAKSGKLIGAGGGGFFLFLVDNPKDKIKLIKSLEKKYIYVPVKFTDLGTEIIYRKEEYI